MNEKRLIRIIRRTEEEQMSYFDGYNACFKAFKKYFEQGISFSDALNNMEMRKSELGYFLERKEE